MAEDDARALTQAVNNLTRVVTNLDELLRRDYPKRAEIERRFTSKQSSRRLVAQGLVLVLVVGLLSGWVAVQLGRQQGCFERELSQLSHTVDSRSSLSERESAQSRALWGVYADAAGLVTDPHHPDISPEDQARLNAKLVHRLLVYKREIDEIQRERRDQPVQSYEPGSC